MNNKSKYVKKYLRGKLAFQIKDILEVYQIPQEEKEAIIACDVKNMSTVQASMYLHVSRECVTRRRCRGYERLANVIEEDDFNIDSIAEM